jgi:phosphoglycolate phosphatase
VTISEPPHAVLYDFDFTLADSSPGVVDCVNCALRQLGLSAAPPDLIRQTIGLSMSATLAHLTGSDSLAPAFTKHFVARADQVMADMTVIYPGVPGVLRTVHQAGIAQGIVSSKYRYRIETTTRREGIRGYFSTIVGGEDTDRHKPDPAALQMALRQLECSPADAVYVGDHTVDAEAAERLGVPFVGVLTGVTAPVSFSRFASLGIVETLTQLPRLLGIDEKQQEGIAT